MPVINMNEAVDRGKKIYQSINIVREIFPDLSNLQIMLEIRRARNNVDQAILTISDNIQRGAYAGLD